MKKLLAVGLLAGAIAVPTAMAAKPAHTPAKPVKPVTKPVKAVVSYLFVGVVAADATADSVDVMSVKGVNRHAKRALGTATTMTVAIKATTKLRGRIVSSDGTKTFVNETYADLKAGDKVYFHIRALKGTSLDNLAKTIWIRDLTPAAPAPPAPVI